MAKINLLPSLLWIYLTVLPYISTAAVFAKPEKCAQGLSSYDFIIVGGGTAGLAVATGLSQRLPQNCILVIEAGKDGRSESGIFIPGRRGSTFGSQYDWNFTTTPQVEANNRKFALVRGKVLGGSSAMNLMAWDRGSKADYDSWEELGNPGWNWKNMITAMLKVENFVPDDEHVGCGVGKGGIIQTLINRILPAHQLGFIPTLNSLGVKTNLASLDGNPIGVMRQPSNIREKDYTRSYSTAYLERAPGNLILLLNTTVAKINSKDKTASGVTLEDGNIISARKEIILSAGTFQSPGILEVSGIGSKSVLAASGVTNIVSDLPGVGENLQDHIRIQSSYQLKPEYVSIDRFRYNTTFAAEQLALWYANQTSLFDYTANGYAFVNWVSVSKSAESSLVAIAKQSADLSSPIDRKKLSYLTNPNLSSKVPQLEIIFVDGYGGVKGYPAVGSPLYGAQYFALLGGIMHPFSKGSIHITSPNISITPVLTTNYLSNKYDLAAIVETAKYLRRIATSPQLASVWTAEYEPGPQVTTDAQWEEFARNSILSINHPVGTCAMLPKKDGGVVDSNLLVYGVKKLRVVDASVIPILISGHIQTAVYGIAERAADIIVNHWK